MDYGIENTRKLSSRGSLGVDKGGDIWEFSTDGLKDLKAKKGDKVTVYYQMVAKKLEMK